MSPHPVPGLLAGRVAVVTGGAAGIGAAIARTLAEAGARGAVLDLAAPEGGAPEGWLALAADVRRADSLAAAFAEVAAALGPLDIAVANAGIVPPWTTTAGIDVAQWDEVMAVNARGAMLTVREFARVTSGRAGAVVVTSSINGWKGDWRIPAYVASKHAVLGLVRSVAQELGRSGIRVNAVGPGPIATDALLGRMASRSGRTGQSVDAALASAAGSTALGRLATVEEVANAVLFLASDLSSGITGQLLAVDAGVL